jgi:hypothetical protein
LLSNSLTKTLNTSTRCTALKVQKKKKKMTSKRRKHPKSLSKKRNNHHHKRSHGHHRKTKMRRRKMKVCIQSNSLSSRSRSNRSLRTKMKRSQLSISQDNREVEAEEKVDLIGERGNSIRGRMLSSRKVAVGKKKMKKKSLSLVGSSMLMMKVSFMKP